MFKFKKEDFNARNNGDRVNKSLSNFDWDICLV